MGVPAGQMLALQNPLFFLQGLQAPHGAALHWSQIPQSLTILDAYVKFGTPWSTEAWIKPALVRSSSLSIGERWVQTKNSPCLLMSWAWTADSFATLPWQEEQPGAWMTK